MPLRAISIALLLAVALGNHAAFAAEDPDAKREAQMQADTPDIDDEDPVASVPDQKQLNRDPLRAGLLLMELSSRAEAAEKDKKYAEAVKFYAALAKAVPDRALGFSKMCEMYLALGQPGDARAACRRATELQGAKLTDHLRYASILLGEGSPGASQAAPPAAADVAELDATFQHLESQQVTAIEVDYLMCKLALRLEDSARVRRCVDRLVQKAPGDPVTLSHQFSLALLELNHQQASAVIEQGRQAGLPPEALKLMEDELDTRMGPKPGVRAAQGLGLVALLGAGAWAARSLWRRRRRTAAA